MVRRLLREIGSETFPFVYSAASDNTETAHSSEDRYKDSRTDEDPRAGLSPCLIGGDIGAMSFCVWWDVVLWLAWKGFR